MPGNTPPWEITGQREDYRPGPTGAFVAGIVISFKLSNGATGSVFIPEAAFTVESARSAVAAKAATMEAVSALTGG